MLDEKNGNLITAPVKAHSCKNWI